MSPLLAKQNRVAEEYTVFMKINDPYEAYWPLTAESLPEAIRTNEEPVSHEVGMALAAQMTVEEEAVTVDTSVTVVVVVVSKVLVATTVTDAVIVSVSVV